MRHGYHMGYGYYGAPILAIVLVIVVIILLIVIINSKKTVDPKIHEPVETLRERFAKGQISAEEYRKKKNMIEGEKHLDQARLILMERYANSEISSKEYIESRKILCHSGINKALDILNERYAKGEISLEEYFRVKKEIAEKF